MVECDLAKVEVAGSNPVSRSEGGPSVGPPSSFLLRFFARRRLLAARQVVGLRPPSRLAKVAPQSAGAKCNPDICAHVTGAARARALAGARAMPPVMLRVLTAIGCRALTPFGDLGARF